LNRADVRAFVDGTVVTERSASGEIIPQGRLNGERFVTTAWSFRRRTREEGCPLWLTKIVISKTKEGANAGAHLALPSEEGPGSSMDSRDMAIIVVDEHGIQQDSFTANFGVVAALFPREPGDVTPPIAAELWFSDSPFDPTLPEVQAVTAVCNNLP
jgi:hypothetical protein